MAHALKSTLLSRGLELHPFHKEQLCMLVGMAEFWPGSNLIIQEDSVFCLLRFVLFEYECFQQKIIDWSINPGRC